MSKYFIAALLTVVLGVSAFAGSKQGYQLSDEMVAYVQMSDSQRAQIQGLRDSLYAQKKELKALDKSDRHAAKVNMKEQYHADLKSILSEDQMAKYKEFRHMNKGKHKKHKKDKEKTEVM